MQNTNPYLPHISSRSDNGKLGSQFLLGLVVLIIAFLFITLNLAAQINHPGYSYGSEYLLTATREYDIGLLKKADRELDQLIEDFPGNISTERALLLEVDIDLSNGNFNMADSKLGEFIKWHPNSPFVSFAAFKRGVINFERNNFREASEYFQTAKLIAESDYEYRRNDVVYKHLAGQSLFWEGVAHSRNGDFDSAYPLFDEVMLRYPDSDYADDALYSLGKIEEMRENYLEAISRFKKLRINYPLSNTYVASLIREANNNITIRKFEAATLNLERADAVLSSILKQDSIGLKYPEQSNSEFARQEILYLRGEAANMAGNYQEALSYFNTFLETFENDDLANFVRLGAGWANLNTGEYGQALDLYDKVIFSDLNKENNQLKEIAQLYRAITLKYKGEVEQARKEFFALAVQAGYPYQGQVLLELAQLQYEEGDYLEARKTLERAQNELIRSQALVRIDLLLGAVYMHLKQYDKAANVYGQAEELAEGAKQYNMPKKDWYIKEARLKKGISEVMSGANARAISDLSSYIAVAGQDDRADEALFWLSEAYFQRNAYKNAIQSFETLLDKYPETKRREDALYAIGWSQFMLKDFKKSSRTFDRLVGEYPQTAYGPEVMTRQGDGFYVNKQYGPAANAYKRATELAPDSEIGQYSSFQRANALFKMGNYEQSITALQQFVTAYRQSPFAPNALYLIGWVKFQQAQYEQAIEGFRYLIEAFPRSIYIPRAHYSIADAFYNSGQYDMAREKYQYVIDTYPDSELAPEALRGIQQSLILLDREDEAIEVINLYTTNNSSSPFVRDFKEKKASILFANGRYEDAIDEYESLIESEVEGEENAEAMYWIGKSYIEMGQPEEAEAAFLRLREKFPDNSFAAKGMLENAMLWKDQANVPKSDSLFATIIESYPGDIVAAQAAFERAILKYGLRDTTTALELFTFVADSFPDNEYGVNARYKLGMFTRKQGLTSEARMHFAKLVQNKVDPGFAAEASYRIGELLMVDEFYEEAIDAFEKTKMEFAGYEDWFSKSLLDQGEAYEKKEMYDNALEVYKALRELRTDDDFGLTANSRIKRIEDLIGEEQ